MTIKDEIRAWLGINHDVEAYKAHWKAANQENARMISERMTVAFNQLQEQEKQKADEARRDEFAKAALHGFLSRGDLDKTVMAEICYAMADAMLAERAKK